jgi:hypothetical protein
MAPGTWLDSVAWRTASTTASRRISLALLKVVGEAAAGLVLAASAPIPLPHSALERASTNKARYGRKDIDDHMCLFIYLRICAMIQ